MDKLTPDETSKLPALRKRLGRPPKVNALDSELTEDAEFIAEDSSSPTSCRRSTRKKIVKFDVLDVLNKSRKTHKIQIEARIDSNAPTTSTQITSSMSTSPSPTIEVNRLITPRPPLPTVPPLLTLDMFAKPKPTPSLIVAQVSSDKPTHQPPPPSVTQQPSTELHQPEPLRKRGRPRKAPSEESSLDVDSDLSNTDASVTRKLDQAEYSLKRASTDSEEFLQSHSGAEAANETSQDDSLFDATIEVIETEIISVASDDDDSDSQIIFVDIEAAKLAAEAEGNGDEITEGAEGDSTRNFRIIFPNENQLQHDAVDVAQEVTVEHQQDEKQPDLEAEVASEPARTWLTDIDKEDEQLPRAEEAQEHVECEEIANFEVATQIEVVSEELTPCASVEPPQSQEDQLLKEDNTVIEDFQQKDEKRSLQEKHNVKEPPQVKLELPLPTQPKDQNHEVKTEQPAESIEEHKDTGCVEAKDEIEPRASSASKGITHSDLESLKRAAKATGIDLKFPLKMERLLNPSPVEPEASKVELMKAEIKEEESSILTESIPLKIEEQSVDSPHKPEMSTLNSSLEISVNSEVPIATEPLAKLKSDRKSNASEKRKASLSPKVEKPAASFVECDALFKDLDKAQAQLRNEEKARKKSKLANKKPPTEPLPVRTTPQPKPKKQPAKTSTRRNTICEERHEEVKLPATPSLKRRNSVHPFKATSPERAFEPERKASSSTKKPAQKKPSRKVTTPRQLPCSQDSLDSSSSSSTRASEVPTRSLPTPTAEIETSNPLHDIEKFIEDGVKLLERDYKVEDEQQEQPLPQSQSQDEPTEDELAQRVANLETPANTPAPSPAGSTDDLSSGVRRSHRIKQKPQGAKSSLGRGSSSQAPTISMEQQLSELAHIETINEQFLRQEGLNTFQTLRDNYYRCARQVSKENAEMQCDCYVTGDEEGQQGQTRCGDGCINRMLMIECGPLCSYGDRCTNKRFQQHQGWPCRVFRTERKGCGITAELQIQPGEFIMEYVGEVIDSEEFERRQHLYSEDRNRHYYFMALRGEAIIDATTKGNISRYINHSCDPNAETQKWTVNGELRIGFFSVKTILPGEEITFDYQYQRYGRDAQRCYCESANCRGWIGNEPETDEGEQLDSDSESESESLVEELRAEQEPKTKAARGSKARRQLKLPTARKQRKEQPKVKDREYKAGRWLRPSGGIGGEKSASRKHDQLEDPDVLEQLTLLSRSGLKNQLDTLRLSRCMVRAKLLQSRLQLLGVLTRGELPCRRLFLDYHGLRLLHAWISESGSDKQLRLALLESLESLPIPNRTMLNDSRVYQSVQLWSSQLSQPTEPAPDSEVLGEQQSEEDESVRQRIGALLLKWNGLPEIFRIPKRERIEQMKEHEREADRQQHVATALGESNSASSVPSTDRYRQDRFRRDTIGRYDKSKAPTRMSGNNTICTITTQPKEWSSFAESSSGSKSESRRRSEFDPRRAISKEMRRSMFERKVAQDEAEKRVGSEDFRGHELRCEYFGADLNTDPKLLPFYQNTETNEWFNFEDVPVPVPLRCGDPAEPPSPEHEDDVEYKLPAGVEPLPPSWHWSLTPEGDIYYYNLRDRIPQWDPPNAEQRLQQLLEESPEKEIVADDAANTIDLINIDIDYVGSLSAKSLAQYIEVKIKERRELRRSRLVSVRVISPRREEDRLYNQLESRKYKENKEKIRRRKEIYRRTRSEANTAPPPAGDSSDTLPIHGYLYSSDEETATEGAGSALPSDATMEGDKEVSEPLARRRTIRPSSPQSISTIEAEALPSAKRKLPASESQKKHRDSKRKQLAAGRDASDKFHFEISGHVADFLRPYRQENCQMGRITSDEDYKFLIKRLSHHITTKEMRYCDLTGNPLACTESVKHKSYDFIKQYMRKKGPVYKRPVDKPD